MAERGTDSTGVRAPGPITDLGRRLELDALQRTDMETIRYWRMLARQTLRTPFVATELQQEAFYRDVASNPNSPHRYYAIRLDRKIFGCCGLTNISWENGTAEISLIVDSANRGRGIGREVVRRLLVEAFERFRLVHVWGEAYRNNPDIAFWERLVADYPNAYRLDWPVRKFWDGRHYGSLLFGWIATKTSE